jgi:hypothetical protein
MHLDSLFDHAFEISAVCVLHYDAKCLSFGEKEGGLVGDDVRHVDWGEEANFIQGGVFLFLFCASQGDWFQGVVALIAVAADQLHAAVAATA